MDIRKLTVLQRKTALEVKNQLLKKNFDIKPKKKQLKNIVKEKVVFNTKPVKVTAAKNKSFKLQNYKYKYYFFDFMLTKIIVATIYQHIKEHYKCIKQITIKQIVAYIPCLKTRGFTLRIVKW